MASDPKPDARRSLVFAGAWLASAAVAASLSVYVGGHFERVWGQGPSVQIAWALYSMLAGVVFVAHFVGQVFGRGAPRGSMRSQVVLGVATALALFVGEVSRVSLSPAVFWLLIVLAPLAVGAVTRGGRRLAT